MPQKDDIYDTGNGVMGAGMSWNDKHRPGCYVNVWRGGLVLGTSKRLATEFGSQKPLYWKKDRGEDDLSRPQKIAANYRPSDGQLQAGVHPPAA